MNDHPTVALLNDKFGTQHCHLVDHHGQMTVTIPKSILLEVLTFLYEDGKSKNYKQLSDIAGIDYKGYPGDKERPRFALRYQLLNIDENLRIAIKVECAKEDMSVSTATTLYNGAGWMEREAMEMFGFDFEGHGDKRKLLLNELFDGKFPQRKTYPVTGEGERDSFTPITRETS